MFRFRYQFRQTLQSVADSACVAGFAKPLENTLESTLSWLKRDESSNAPQWPLPGEKPALGSRPLYDSFSPVIAQAPAICHALLLARMSGCPASANCAVS